MRFIYVALAVLLCLSPCACANVSTNGLILHLDAAEQIKAGGAGPGNSVWKNLASQPDSVAGSTTIHAMKGDGTSGWVGSGSPAAPYALRFDGITTYASGPGNLDLPEITLEAWAKVDGYVLRGATLIGNDFGKGGISLMILPSANSPVLLHDRTFTQIGAETPGGEWHQVVVALKDGIARFYVDGVFACATPAEHTVDPNHYPGYNIGHARFPEHDYPAADALKGEIAIIRVYNRAISGAEVKGNFDADSGRFAIARDPLRDVPATSTPVPTVTGMETPPARCAKWDYYYNPVGVTSSAVNATCAFNGYPASVKHPIENMMCGAPLPTPEKPVEFIINYKRLVAVTRFTNYYDRYRGRNAWKDVDVYASDDQETWTHLQSFRNLPLDPVQYLGIDKPSTARFYKIAVKSLSEGSGALNTQEIETYYGTTIGNVTSARGIQSEGCRLSVRVVSPDSALSGAVVRITAPKGSVSGQMSAALPSIAMGSSSSAEFDVTPLHPGRIPVSIELYSGKFLIDKRPYTIVAEPKLALGELSPAGAVVVAPGAKVEVTGKITNSGSTSASDVSVSWLGQNASLGSLAPGESASFRLDAKAPRGYSSGEITVSSADGAKTVIRRSVICQSTDGFTEASGPLKTDWSRAGDAVKVSASSGGDTLVTGALSVLTGATARPLVPVASDGKSGTLAAMLPGGVLLAKVTASKLGDPSVECTLVPDDPYPIVTPWIDMEIQMAVDNPKVMFRPHIDWYTAEHGPNFPTPTNAHNSTTRMLCIQTPKATLSMVPDTDNLTWGFTADNRMTASFQIPFAPYDELGEGIMRSIYETPTRFSLALPVRKGDWWDAYRHVVEDIFKFEEPRQWAMPITQMQMLTVRELMSYQAWSEKWQNVKVYSSDNVFWPFYASNYTLPAIYSWYLATDDQTAKVKSEKVIDWLLSVQHNDAPMQGGWFTAYFGEGTPAKMVGTDFIHNRWLIPHGTGAVVKTLLWYWNASGRKDSRVLEAARRGADWLLRTMRPDGGWPYAFDLDGSKITDQCGAGQIWCTWALWEMYRFTGETKYRDAALTSKAFFKKTYMDVHRYVGYWEDTVGITKDQNQKINSWECYEASLACLVFADMGDKDLAIEAAKDTAVWSWTRVISTRQYETSYGQTTEQSLCGPSQAQSPMIGVSMHQIYEITGDELWRDFSGAVKAVNFSADPEQEYGMTATSGWNQPLTGVAGPPYDNVRPFVTPDMKKGDYGRQLWTGWCTDQFAWLALNWLIREANIRAPQYVQVDPDTLRGTVLGSPGRVKMPEEKCDVNGIEHYDINWVGYQNDLKYALLVMNHKEKLTVAIRPHEAHLDVYTREPRILVGSGKDFHEVKVVKKGVQYMVDIPAGGNAVLVWDRIK